MKIKLLFLVLWSSTSFAQFTLHHDIPNYSIDSSTPFGSWAFTAGVMFEMINENEGGFIEEILNSYDEETNGLNIYLTNNGWASDDSTYLKGLSTRQYQSCATKNYIYLTVFTDINHWRGYGHRYMIRMQPEFLTIDTIYFDSIDHQGVSYRNLSFINDSVGVYSGTNGQYLTTDYAESWTKIHSYFGMHNIATYGDYFVTQVANDRYFFNSQTFVYDSLMDYLPCEGASKDGVQFQGKFYRGWRGQDGPQQGFSHNNYGGIEWHDFTAGSLDFIYFPDPIHFNDFEATDNYMFSPFYGRMVVSSDPMNEWHYLENLPIDPATGATIFVHEMEVVNDSVIYVFAQRPNGVQRDYEIWKTTNMGGGPQGEVHTVKKTNALTKRANTSMAAFPIPFQNELHVQVKSKARYQLVDLTGKVVLSGFLQAGEQMLQTSGIPQGFYLLKVSGYPVKQVLKN